MKRVQPKTMGVEYEYKQRGACVYQHKWIKWTIS
jgi:hypothetical protein